MRYIAEPWLSRWARTLVPPHHRRCLRPRPAQLTKTPSEIPAPLASCNAVFGGSLVQRKRQWVYGFQFPTSDLKLTSIVNSTSDPTTTRASSDDADWACNGFTVCNFWLYLSCSCLYFQEGDRVRQFS